MSAAGTWNFVADQGATLSKVLTYKDANGTPVDLTNYTARMQLRERTNSTSVALELTTANGRITLGGAAGTVTLSVPATSMTITGTYVYDLELVSGATVTRLVMGEVFIRPEVTR